MKGIAMEDLMKVYLMYISGLNGLLHRSVSPKQMILIPIRKQLLND